MRFSAIMVVLAMLAGTNSCFAAGDSTATIRVDDIARIWMEAYNTGDSARLASLYTDDAFYVSPHLGPLSIRGREEVVVNFLRGIRGGGHVDSISVLSSTLSGDMAYAVCTYYATNSSVQVQGRTVLVLRFRVGGWRIAVHASIVRD